MFNILRLADPRRESGKYEHLTQTIMTEFSAGKKTSVLNCTIFSPKMPYIL